MDQAATRHEMFTNIVMSAVRASMANASTFDAQHAADIYEHVQDTLLEVDPAEVSISPEAYATCLLQRSAKVVSYRPGWRDGH